MDSKESATLLSAIKFLTGDCENICRLCLCSTMVDQETHIDINVMLQKPYYNESINFIDIFTELGMKEEPLLPTVLCADCSTMTINCFLFYKLWKYSVDKWNEALQGLAESMTQLDTLQPNVQSIYLMVSNSENIMFTSRKRPSVLNKKNAIIKIKDIVKSRRTYAKTKEKVSSIICTECGETFKCKYNLTKHVVKAHTQSKVPCSICPKVFITRTQLEEHVERVHLPKRIQCPKCPKKFSTERMLKAHDKVNHIATICKLCFVQLPSKAALRSHLDKHDTNRCPYCNKEFINRHTFKLHMKLCNEIDKQPNFFCDICNKGYLRKNGLRTHLKIDHGFGKVLTCKWCNKKFDAISRLKNHIVKHTKEKNFHCEHCGGRFVTQPALIYHIRLHTGERPFPCDMCDESFLSASRRMEHKRRKHFEPTKECHVCHVKFVTGNQLRKHVERHNNPQSKLYVPDISGIQNYTLATIYNDNILI